MPALKGLCYHDDQITNPPWYDPLPAVGCQRSHYWLTTEGNPSRRPCYWWRVEGGAVQKGSGGWPQACHCNQLEDVGWHLMCPIVPRIDGIVTAAAHDGVSLLWIK